MHAELSIALFVSPHGFGHAARAVAVVHELAQRSERLRVQLFTLVPEWFFRSSLPPSVVLEYHALQTDVGFVQHTSLQEDLPATVERLEALYPLSPALRDSLAGTLRSGGAQLVLCDISAVGILAAETAGLPSVLLENFTWDWIYAPYLEREPRLAKFSAYLAPLYSRATRHIQTTPCCRLAPGARLVGPIARRPRRTVAATRQALGIPADGQMVLMTMGGMPGHFPFMERLGGVPELHFVLAGVESHAGLPANVRAVPHQSPFFHPDLVLAADAIVGKVGYGTVAEAFQGRTQFFYVPRPAFPESAVMEHFVREELHGVEVPLADFEGGEWLAKVADQLAPVPPLLSKGGADGANAVADEIAALCR